MGFGTGGFCVVFFFFLKETGDKLNGGWFCDLHVLLGQSKYKGLGRVSFSQALQKENNRLRSVNYLLRAQSPPGRV